MMLVKNLTERRGVFQQTSPVVIRTGTSIAASISSSSATSHGTTTSVVSASPRLASGLLDVDGRSLEHGVVQIFDCLGCVFLAGHVHETVAVHHVTLCHLAEAQEQVAQLLAAAILRQPANEDLCLPLEYHAHIRYPNSLSRTIVDWLARK